MRLMILGSGTPGLSSTQYGSAYVVSLEDENFMFDCGPATTYKLLKLGKAPAAIGYLFFTHHHYDHNADYAGFSAFHGGIPATAMSRNCRCSAPRTPKS